jgi:hypothetical protein
MISVSQEAKEFLETVECAPGKVLRLAKTVGTNGKRLVRFEFGDPEPGDEVLWRAGETAMHVPRSGNEGFAGYVVKRVDGPEGTGIVLAPPDAGRFSF